jgi:alkyl hydroperoxide reductase subunit D
MCIDSHVGVLLKHDISAQVIQNSIKMAAVLNAAATAKRIA